MEQQVAVMEEKIRQEENEKLQQQKQEAHAQLLKANDELNEMENKIVAVSKQDNPTFQSYSVDTNIVP